MDGRIAHVPMVRAQPFPLRKEFCGICGRLNPRVRGFNCTSRPFFSCNFSENSEIRRARVSSPIFTRAGPWCGPE
jgi:hypothetical protein